MVFSLFSDELYKMVKQVREACLVLHYLILSTMFLKSEREMTVSRASGKAVLVSLYMFDC